MQKAITLKNLVMIIGFTTLLLSAMSCQQKNGGEEKTIVAGTETANANGANKNERAVWDAKDAALAIIDYQPEMFSVIKSSKPKMIELNVRYLARIAKAFNMPIVLSTVAVKMGINKPTIDSLKADLPGIMEIDRTSMDAWEDTAFVSAVKATGKKRIIMVGLFTEICLAYAVVNARRDGLEVMFVEDAVGGLSKEAHDLAVQRMIQAGAIPNTALALASELFRDWRRPEGELFKPVMGWYFGQLNSLALAGK